MNSSDIENQLISYIRESQKARKVLSQLRGMELSSMDLQNALCKTESIDPEAPQKLLNKKYSEIKIVNLLKKYDFVTDKPELLQEIVLDESILPKGTRKLLTEKTVKIKGEVWMVHKNDVDPFPSSPHAHNYGSGVSLHLGTGEFFNKKESKGRLSCKKLKNIRKKLGKITLPKLEVKCK